MCYPSVRSFIFYVFVTQHRGTLVHQQCLRFVPISVFFNWEISAIESQRNLEISIKARNTVGALKGI